MGFFSQTAATDHPRRPRRRRARRAARPQAAIAHRRTAGGRGSGGTSAERLLSLPSVPPPAAPVAAIGDLSPIAGVDLVTYAKIVRSIARHGFELALLPTAAATHGIDAARWRQAHDGWNRRIQDHSAVATAFSAAYRSL